MAITPAPAPLRLGEPHPQGPAALISRRAADRLRTGHPWVYRTDVTELRPAPGRAEVPAGALVTILDSRGTPLGSALFSSASQITLRLVSEVAGLTRAQYLEEVATRTAAALTLRDQLAPTGPDNNAARLIFSEADQLPGIIADRYHDLILLQLLTQGTAQDDLRETLTRVLRAHFGDTIATIVERPDPKIRIAEELAPAPDQPLYTAHEEPKLTTTFTLNGLAFAYDASAGQKTGAFLDQRLNYAAAAAHAASIPNARALDICTYQGGFALHLARVCARVTGVDASRAALEVADANLDRNAAQIKAKNDWIEADAFDLLRDFDSANQRFDTIVLDPPAFAKSKRALEGAMRGYKELNLRALRMLSPRGTLVTCSCSQHVPLADFTAILASAAADAHRRVQLIETRGAAPDHPAILTLPETAYLKCLIARVQ